MITKTMYVHSDFCGEVYDEKQDMTVPGRYKSMQELITRFASGSSTGNIVRQVEYDDNPDVDAPDSPMEDHDLSYCDLPSLEKTIEDKVKMLENVKKNATTTTTNDDDDATI